MNRLLTIITLFIVPLLLPLSPTPNPLSPPPLEHSPDVKSPSPASLGRAGVKSPSPASLGRAGVGSPSPASLGRAGVGSKIDPFLLQSASSGPVEFLVYLQEQADLSAAALLPTKAEKGAYVYQQLTALANRSQAPLIAELQAQGLPYQPFWIANMLWVRGNLAAIQAIAGRSDVAHLYLNPTVSLPIAPPSPVSPGSDAAQVASIEWNITLVGAPKVWAAGFTGQGAVVAGQDTGYDWDHPAIKQQYRGWDGAVADHDYNWHDAIHSGGSNTCGFNALEPCDDNGHGTHTMGSMVGDDGAGNQVGMAPGARWIGCRNMNKGAGTPATYAECFQWFVAPTRMDGSEPRPDMAPDVINNSWTCPSSEGCTLDSLKLVVENTRSAGIMVVASAGNSGPSCTTISDPPAIYDASFTIGATDNADNIAGFSSRGATYGSGLPKPDVSAPGVNIRSSTSIPVVGGYSTMSGTSMAGPHVVGLVALAISIRPDLRGKLDLIETLIEHSAVPRTNPQTCGGIPGSSIPNNTYGWGRIDAWATYLRLQNIYYFPIIYR
jgi:serine protease AprX